MRTVIGGSLVRVGNRIRGQRKAKPSTGSRVVMSRSESRALLEERTQRQLGMTATEFERRLVAGDLPDTSTVRSLAFLVGEVPAR